VLGALEMLNTSDQDGSGASPSPALLQQPFLPPDAAHWYQTLKENAQTLSETLENVMNYSAIQRGLPRPVCNEVPLRALLNGIDSQIAGNSSHKEVNVHRWITRSVSSDRLTLYTDGGMLGKVVAAGISNAIKFSSQVGGSVWIRVSRVGGPAHRRRCMSSIRSWGREEGEETVLPAVAAVPASSVATASTIPARDHSATADQTPWRWARCEAYHHDGSRSHIQRDAHQSRNGWLRYCPYLASRLAGWGAGCEKAGCT
jgi:hypothetical protein